MINIDTLSESELVELNHRVVARIKFMRQLRANVQMLDFVIGERVSFQSDGYTVHHGIVTKHNTKTISVITDDGEQWNVSPGFLRKASASTGQEAITDDVIDLPW